jgi:AraC-like DNA-binding protein
VSQRGARGDVRASLIGPRTDPLPLTVSPADRIWAVRFWPDTGGAILGIEAERLAGHFVTPLSEPSWAASMLKELARCASRSTAAQVMDSHLTPVVEEVSIDAAVRAAVQALILSHGELPIADVATGVGLSLRQLERRFLSAVGLNPVQYARIRKARGELLTLLGGLSWADVAPKLGEARP